MEQSNQILSYIFRFQEPVLPHAISVSTVGWEKTEAPYSFTGQERDDPGGSCLFQYTIAGSIMIRVNDKLFRLEPGKAFFVPFKSDYHYYKLADQDYYECLFLSMDGAEAVKCLQYVQEQYGPVLDFQDSAQPIQFLRHMHQEAQKKKITDTYKLSMMGYQFVMELYRHFKGYSVPVVWPELIVKAARLIDEHCHELQQLDDLTRQLGVSKYHFIKLFHRTVGKTPVEYITKKRMEKATQLLRSTDLSLDEIALQVGYANVNYFSKVFRKCFGVPPGQYRKKYDSYDFMLD